MKSKSNGRKNGARLVLEKDWQYVLPVDCCQAELIEHTHTHIFRTAGSGGGGTTVVGRDRGGAHGTGSGGISWGAAPKTNACRAGLVLPSSAAGGVAPGRALRGRGGTVGIWTSDRDYLGETREL